MKYLKESLFKFRVRKFPYITKHSNMDIKTGAEFREMLLGYRTDPSAHGISCNREF